MFAFEHVDCCCLISIISTDIMDAPYLPSCFPMVIIFFWGSAVVCNGKFRKPTRSRTWVKHMQNVIALSDGCFVQCLKSVYCFTRLHTSPKQVHFLSNRCKLTPEKSWVVIILTRGTPIFVERVQKFLFTHCGPRLQTYGLRARQISPMRAGLPVNSISSTRVALQETADQS